MTKVIWMSDPHFSTQGPILGHDPVARLTAAVSYVATTHADAKACIISGDLVDVANAENYMRFAELTAPLPMPLLPMVGNHDARAPLCAALPIPDNTMEDFVQYRLDLPEATLLCLDTLYPGHESGMFCNARQAWLSQTLSDTDRPTYLFMHHPPMPLGLPAQDADRLANGETFIDTLIGHTVDHLFIGHVHRPVCGTYKGISYSTMSSILLQAPPPHPSWDWDSFTPPHEAPSLGVLTFSPTGVTLQYENFCAADEGACTP